MNTTARRLGIGGILAFVSMLTVFSVTSTPGAAASAGVWLHGFGTGAQAEQRLAIRGHAQTLRLYGPRTGTPVVLSSGDGGWFHLAPQVASLLASRGCFVVGFDVRAYLQTFTRGASALRPQDVPRDYQTLIAFASQATGRKPILVGASEGAGLSVLAASDPAIKSSVAGVVGLGLPDRTELGWRWRDAVIYFTHQSPDEPAFNVRTIVDRLAPLPLAAVHSTHDEYAPLAEVQQILASARQPKRLWVVNATNHRFSGNADGLARALRDAFGWIDSRTTRRTDPPGQVRGEHE
jgi:hypothetical protein